MAEKLILNALNTALTFAQSKVSNLLERKVVVFDKSDLTRPRKVAVVDSGNVDDNMTGLAERINREPGLEQFQLFLGSSTAVVPKSQYPQTRFMACASNSKHGYWEVFGVLPAQASATPTPATSTTATSAISTTNSTATKDPAADKVREIAIFAGDIQKAVGSVFISPSATLLQLRTVVADEVELPSWFNEFQFVRLGAPSTGSSKPSLVNDQDEPTTKISSVMAIANDKDACVRVAKAQVPPSVSPSLLYHGYLLHLQPIEIGIKLESTNKKVGFIENVPFQSRLDAVKVHITDQTEIDFEFRFLTISDNNISLNQEKSRVLQSIIRYGENGDLYFVVRKV